MRKNDEGQYFMISLGILDQVLACWYFRMTTENPQPTLRLRSGSARNDNSRPTLQLPARSVQAGAQGNAPVIGQLLIVIKTIMPKFGILKNQLWSKLMV